MVEIDTPNASAAAQTVEDPELLKQQAQLAQFNEYIHKCRDLYKSDPTMVSFHKCNSNTCIHSL